MEMRCGVDVVEDARVMQAVNDAGFVERVYQPSERQYVESKKAVSIFGIKEAVIKALELPVGCWLQIVVWYSESGRPVVQLGGNITPDGLLGLDVSVSHEAGLTTAMAVAWFK